MNKIIFSLLMIILFNCSFIEPSYLVIENTSNYTIKIETSQQCKSIMILEKNQGDFILTYPGDIQLKISIDEIEYHTETVINMKYQEKKRYVFSISDVASD